MPDMPSFSTRISPQQQNALWQLVQTIFQVDLTRWTRLHLNGVHLGYLNPHWRAHLCQDWPLPMLETADSIDLQQADNLALADALQNMAQQWHRLGLLSGWRNEPFDVRNPAGQTLFALERAAFRPLGLASRAVHINGLVHTAGGWRFWIARRSPFKAVDPNKLDNLVGGGIASGESVHTAMLREGFEEAGLSETVLTPLQAQSVQHSLRAVSRGLHREWLHIFDAVLPEDVLPQNQDGEVAEFMQLTLAEVVAAMLDKRFMNDALLATLDMFERLNLLDADLPLAQWLRQGRGVDVQASA